MPVERAVLALALDDRDCEVILDDRDAKRCAQTLGISAAWDARPGAPGEATG